MSGGKGGSQTSSVEVPKWLERAAQSNLGRADDISRIGYVPYYGPDVAAFTPMQQAAFSGTNQAAGAFGMPAAVPPMLPEAQTFAGGVQGYSSAPMYEEALAALQAANPGQYAAITGMFIDPTTGMQTSGVGGQMAPAPLTFQDRIDALGYGPGRQVNPGSGDGSNYQGSYGDRQAQAGMADAMRGGSLGLGGYSGVGDMFDGGGPGASGGRFSGGGLISSAANAVTGRR